MTPGFKRLAAQSHREAGPDIVAERHRAQEMRAIYTEPLPGREGSGHYRATGMRLRGGVRVVGLVGVSQHPVDEGCFNRAAQNIRGDNRGDFLTTIGANEADGITS